MVTTIALLKYAGKLKYLYHGIYNVEETLKFVLQKKGGQKIL